MSETHEEDAPLTWQDVAEDILRVIVLGLVVVVCALAAFHQ